MDLNIKISERVISILKHNKIKREALAEAIGKDKYKLDNYLQGKAKWDINFIVSICSAFEISLEDLLNTNYIPPIKLSGFIEPNTFGQAIGMVAEQGPALYKVSEKSNQKSQKFKFKAS